MWQALNFEQISCRSWNDEFFIYNPVTGNTHVLNELSWLILQHLKSEPKTVPNIQTLLAAEFPDSAEELSADMLLQHIQQMHIMGLVKQASENTDWLQATQ